MTINDIKQNQGSARSVSDWARLGSTRAEYNPTYYDGVEQQTSRPDGYGPIDWMADSMTSFLVKMNEVQEMNELGRISKDITPKLNLVGLAEESFRIKNEINNLFDQLDKNPELYPVIAREMDRLNQEDRDNGYTAAYNALARDNSFNLNPQSTDEDKWNVLQNFKTDLQQLEQEARDNALTDRQDIERLNRFHKVSDYFTDKSAAGNISFTDIDTYLYKVPGIAGSSGATWMNSVAAFAGGVLASAALGGKLGATAGPYGAAAGAIVGGGAALASNIDAKVEESYGLVHEAYVSNLDQLAEKNGIDTQLMLDRGRRLLELMQRYQGIELTDEVVKNAIYSNEIQSGDKLFDRLRIDALKGLGTIYDNNMTLVGWDLAQTALEVAPMGKILSGIAKPFASIANASKYGRKASAAATRTALKIGDSVGGFANTVKTKFDKVAMFGLDNNLSGLRNSLKLRTAYRNGRDVIGNMLASGAMEGLEEGQQYVFQKDYENGKYSGEETFLENAVLTLGAGARAAMAYVGLPWDPELVSDDEFIDNVKGGMLLGGLTTGATMTGRAVVNAKRQSEANDFVSRALQSRFTDIDNVLKGIFYSKEADALRNGRIRDSFELLKSSLIPGINEQILNEEYEDFVRVSSIAQSLPMKDFAKSIGIAEGTNEYDLLLGMLHGKYKKFQEANEQYGVTTLEQLSMFNNAQLNQYADQFDSEYTNVVKSAVILNERIAAIDELLAELPVVDSAVNPVNPSKSLIDERKVQKSLLNSLKNDATAQLALLVKDNPDILNNENIGTFIVPQLSETFRDANKRHLYSTLSRVKSGMEYQQLDPALTKKNRKRLSNIAEMAGEQFAKNVNKEFAKNDEDLKKFVQDYIKNFQAGRKGDTEIEQAIYELASGIAEAESNPVLTDVPGEPIADMEAANPTPEIEKTVEQILVEVNASVVQPGVEGEPLQTEGDSGQVKTDDRGEVTYGKQVRFGSDEWNSFAIKNEDIMSVMEDPRSTQEQVREAEEIMYQRAEIEEGWVVDKDNFKFYHKLEPDPEAITTRQDTPDSLVDNMDRTNPQVTAKDAEYLAITEEQSLNYEIAQRAELYNEIEDSLVELQKLIDSATLSATPVAQDDINDLLIQRNRLKQQLSILKSEIEAIGQNPQELAEQVMVETIPQSNSAIQELPAPALTEEAVPTAPARFDVNLEFKKLQDLEVALDYLRPKRGKNRKGFTNYIGEVRSNLIESLASIVTIMEDCSDALYEDLRLAYNDALGVISSVDNIVKQGPLNAQWLSRLESKLSAVNEIIRNIDNAELVKVEQTVLETVHQDYNVTAEETIQPEPEDSPLLNEPNPIVDDLDKTPIDTNVVESSPVPVKSEERDNSNTHPELGREQVSEVERRGWTTTDTLSNIMFYNINWTPDQILIEGHPNVRPWKELAEITLNEDFLKEVEAWYEIVPTRNTGDNIYIIMNYKGNEYAAKVPTKNELTKFERYRGTDSEGRSIMGAFDQRTKDQIVKNLTAIRSEISRLKGQAVGIWRNTGTEPRIMVGKMERTTGAIKNLKDNDGNPIYRKLTEVAKLGLPSPMDMNKNNVQISIATGENGSNPYALRTDYLDSMHSSSAGSGVVMLRVKPLYEDQVSDTLVLLAPMHFRNHPEVADMIIQLMINDRQYFRSPSDPSYITSLKNQLILDLIVNNGIYTKMDEEKTSRYNNPELVQQLKLKQLYRVDGSQIVISGEVFNIQDLRQGNGTVYTRAKELLMQNFHSRIAADNLWDNYIGGQKDEHHPLNGLNSFFDRTDSPDTMTIVPGVIEITKASFTRDENHPRGMSMLGWYVEQGMLMTDIADDLFTNANLYHFEPYLESTAAGKQMQVNAQVEKPAPEVLKSEYNQTPELKQKESEGIVTNDQAAKADPALTALIYLKYFRKRKPGANMTIGSHLKIEETIDPVGAKKWLTNIFGFEGLDVELTDTVIDVLKSGQLYVVGRTHSDSIILSTVAPEGTEFHEAWHRVSNLMLSDSRRNKIAAQMNRRYFNDMYDLTTDQGVIDFDEAAAEFYRDFMMQNRKLADYNVNRWFNAIRTWVTAFAKFRDFTLARIFTEMNFGKFRNVRPNKANVVRINRLYKDGINKTILGSEFRNFQTIGDVMQVVDSLTAELIDMSNIDSVEAMKRLDWAQLKDSINEAANDPQAPDTFREINEKWNNFFVPSIAQRINSMGIKGVNIEADEVLGDLDSGDSIYSTLGEHLEDSLERSHKANAAAEVKLFIAKLFEKKFDEKNNAIDVYDPVTGFPRLYNFSSSWNKVMKELSGIDTLEEVITKVNRLAETDAFFASMNEALAEEVRKNRNSNLLTQLEVTLRMHNSEYLTGKYGKDENGRLTQKLYNATMEKRASSYAPIWSKLFYDNEAFFTRTDSEFDTIVIDITQKNLENINTVMGAYTELSNRVKKVYTSNNSMYHDPVTGLDVDLTTIEGLGVLKRDIINLFGSINIDVSLATLNQLLESNAYKSIHPLQSINNFLNNYPLNIANPRDGFRMSDIFGKNGKFGDVKHSVLFRDENGRLKGVRVKEGNRTRFVNYDKVFNNSKFIKQLAITQASTNTTSSEISELGADGVRLQSIVLHNFVSNRVQDINKSIKDGQRTSDSVLDNLMKATYNKGSIFFNMFNEGLNPRLSLLTFAAFREDAVGDKGRDYFLMSDAEDYIVKMTMALQGYAVFPTLSDKKRCHTLTGLTIKSGNITWELQGGVILPNFNGEVVNQIENYMRAELQTIIECQNDIDNRPKDELILNYHVDKKGNSNKANGVFFRLVTGVYKYDAKLGKIVFINFNDPRLSTAARVKLANDTFFNADLTTRNRMLNDYLRRAVEEECARVEKLGLIQIDRNKKQTPFASLLQNKLLDQTLLESRIKFYESSPISAISSNAMGYAVFDLIGLNVTSTIQGIQEIERLFVGDPAFFKWTRDDNGNIVDTSIDKYKRLGGMTSTGSMNRLDWVGDDFLNGVTNYTVAELLDIEIKSPWYESLKNIFLHGNAEDIRKQHPNAKDEEVMAAAEAKAEAQANSYSDVNIADAEVIVTPKMYRYLMKMSGRWSDEIEAAYNLLEGDDTTWMEDPALYKRAVLATLQPLKYTSYGTRFNPSMLHLATPFYNKMAIFPLFKFMATGENIELYNRMTRENDPIDMVLFNSAVKVGSQSPTKYGVDNLNNLKVYQQEFKYLRNQLNTDPHHSEELMAGTQMMKVVLSNIDPSKQYGKTTGLELRDKVMGILNTLSDRGRQNVLKQVASLVNGEYQIDFKKFSDILMNEARQSNGSTNLMQGLALNADETNFVLPLSALSDDSWLESRFNSFINKLTIDVSLPGGAFVLMSTFGFTRERGLILSDNVYNKYKLFNDGKPLKLKNENGSMDAVISINLFQHIIPNFERLSFTEQRQWLFDKGIIGENSQPNGIGYRIPTQAAASVAALRFVDVLPQVLGDTIVLPAEITKLTGSDFDIDKMYISRFAFDKTVTGKIKLTKTEGDAIMQQFYSTNYGRIDNFLKNMYPNHLYDTKTDTFYLQQFDSFKPTVKEDGSMSDNYLKNELIQHYIDILVDPDNQHVLKQSIDIPTGMVKSIEKEISDATTTTNFVPMLAYLPSFQQLKKMEYTGSKAGIGPMALNNAHHVLTQLYNIKFADSEVVKKHGIKNLDGIYDQPIPGKLSVNYITDWLSALINAFVDIAKDPYISRMNVNQWTYNMTTMLIRAGKGLDTFYFMSQPILKEMAAAAIATEGTFGQDTSMSKGQRSRAAVEKIEKFYILKLNELSITDQQKAWTKELLKEGNEYNKHIFSASFKDDTFNSNLKRMLLEPAPNEYQHYFNLVMVYNTWKELELYSQALADLVKASKVDTKRFGATAAEHEQFNKVVESVKNSELFEGERVRDMFRDSFLDVKMQNSMNLTDNILGNLLLRNTRPYRRVFNSIVDETGVNVDSSTARIINKGIEALTKADFFYNYAKDNGIGINNLFYGKNSMARRLKKLRTKIKKSYPEMLDANNEIRNVIFLMLNENLATNYDPVGMPDLIDTNTELSDDSYFKDNVIISWQELLESDHEDIRTFARDLAVYSFFASGDNAGMNRFFNYVPNSFRLESGYGNHIDNVLLNPMYGMPDKDTFYQNHWYDNDIVNEVDLYIVEEARNQYGQPIFTDTGVLTFLNYFLQVESTQPLASTMQTYPLIMIGKRQTGQFNGIKAKYIDGTPYFKPYVKMRMDPKGGPDKFVLYKYVGYTTYYEAYKGKNQRRHAPVYIAVNKKGMRFDSHLIYEGANLEQSVLRFNNLIQTGESLLPLLLDRDIDTIVQNGRNVSQLAYELLQTFIPAPDQYYQPEDQASSDPQTVVNNVINFKQLNSLVAQEGYVSAMRQEGHEHYGNPFTGTDRGKGTIRMNGIVDAVNAYRQWLLQEDAVFTDKFGNEHSNVAPELRQWILDLIKNGALDGQTLVYYRNTLYGHYYSHADALSDIVNNFERFENVVDQSYLDNNISDFNYPIRKVSNNTYRVWHSSDTNITQFTSGFSQGYFASVKGGNQDAIFFADRAPEPQSFLSKRKYQMEFDVTLQNPLIVNEDGSYNRDAEGAESFKEIVDRAVENGHDGVIIYDTLDNQMNTSIVVAFDPQQIKKVEQKPLQLTFDFVNDSMLSIINENRALSTPDKPLEIYPDGNDYKGTGMIGYGAVMYVGSKQFDMSGTEVSEAVTELKKMFPDAEFSNPTMELLALVETLKFFDGRPEHLSIKQDYKGIVNYDGLWQKGVESDPQRDAKPWTAQMPYIKYLVEQAVNEISKIENNGGSVTLQWIKNKSSEQTMAADAMAKNRDNFNNFNDAYKNPSDKC